MKLIERPQTLAEFIVNDIVDSLYKQDMLDFSHLTSSEESEMRVELTTVIQRRLIEWSRDARRKIAEDKG